MQRVCVFCGSNMGIRPVYQLAAEAMGKALAKRGLELVYGGGNVGLMGVVADATLNAGGKVIGVIPQLLVDKELAHPNLTQLHIVNSMHERKALMADLSDAFIALPGGFGTFEEFCEVLTWSQLGIHHKAFGLLNVERYYDNLLALFDHAVDEQFLAPKHRSLVLQSSDPDRLLDALLNYQPVMVDKWLNRSQR
ncbi:TIGR00730 family Rossman fold protein [Oscillatoria sp. FACHB-1407]|uniref:LOG family protein n=1 Tax=Oscillatoria sp. FACHB-1407 TaxID=2692847 RepID=UPI001683A4AA|nr:TIGR00730 family Rossman fold protein [Oscillatoria sp. FACHB-1407]MBD2465835.1 TIGR00730 family Rossman fold protein [Oscillatoria sp. FACHB-1407]